MSERFEYDVVVLGAGLAGFSVALGLLERGKTVAVVSQYSGATSLSSGAWDLGPVGDVPRSLSACLESNDWKKIYSSVLCPWTPSAEIWQQTIEKRAAALGEFLPFLHRWERPFLLPAASGWLRSVFVVQACQGILDLETRKQRVAVVSSRRWRYQGDLLAGRWNHWARQKGYPVEFRAIDLPLEEAGWDLPLSRVAVELKVASRLETLCEVVAKLTDSVDAFVFPPIFPNYQAFQRLKNAVPLPVSECLASSEPTAGFRLHEAINRALEKRAVARFGNVSQVHATAGRVQSLTVSLAQGQSALLGAGAFVLATGRFLGGGLAASHQRVQERLFGAPLYTAADGKALTERPSEKVPWDRVAGLWLDDQFRPLAQDGKPCFQNLYACGSIIGGLDYAANQVGLGFFAVTGGQCATSVA